MTIICEYMFAVQLGNLFIGHQTLDVISKSCKWMKLPFCMMKNVKNVEGREEQSFIKGQRRGGEEGREGEAYNLCYLYKDTILQDVNEKK